MSRFVLRYRGKGSIPAPGLERVRATGASILEQAPRMLLVEANEHALHDVLNADPDWLVAPEISYGVPNPKRSVR